MKKKPLVIGIIGICVVVSLIIFALSGKAIGDKLKVSFSGYDGVGVVSYNEKEIQKEVRKKVLKKIGFEAKELEKLSEKQSLIEEVTTDEKILKYQKVMNEITIGFDKQTNLYNGDEINFTVTTKNKDFKEINFSKHFRVSDLQQSQKITIDSIISQSPITLQGYDHYGEAKFDSHVFELSKATDLKNGDIVEVNVAPAKISDLAKEGKALEKWKDTKKIEVTNLEDVTKLEGIEDAFYELKKLAIEKINSVKKDNTVYIVEQLNKYVKYLPVGVNNTYYKENGVLLVQSVFRVTEETEKQAEKAFYVAYATSTKQENNKVVIDELTKSSITAYPQNFDTAQPLINMFQDTGCIAYSK